MSGFSTSFISTTCSVICDMITVGTFLGDMALNWWFFVLLWPSVGWVYFEPSLPSWYMWVVLGFLLSHHTVAGVGTSLLFFRPKTETIQPSKDDAEIAEKTSTKASTPPSPVKQFKKLTCPTVPEWLMDLIKFPCCGILGALLVAALLFASVLFCIANCLLLTPLLEIPRLYQTLIRVILGDEAHAVICEMASRHLLQAVLESIPLLVMKIIAFQSLWGFADSVRWLDVWVGTVNAYWLCCSIALTAFNVAWALGRFWYAWKFVPAEGWDINRWWFTIGPEGRRNTQAPHVGAV